MSAQKVAGDQRIAVPLAEEIGELWLPPKPTSLWRDAWYRLIRNRLAVAGGGFVVLMVVVAILAEVLMPFAYDRSNLPHANEGPAAPYILGTDFIGRDILSRIIYGARVSLLVGLGAQVIVLLVGIPIGAMAGYYGGKLDLYLMRFVDVMYAFPQLLFVILITTMLGANLFNIFLAIGITGWVGLARQVRAQILSLREREYVKAARVAGASGPYIIARHLIPNTLTVIIVSLTFGIPLAIFTEATLSFLGQGIKPPIPSWGQMVGENQQYIRSYWHMTLFPALALGLTMLSFTFFGDGLRDALDPRMNR
ncbi:MAG: ABC transporter permease [Chloroflexi bacterium]|nr:ABC transporter permease [Chloroflexota bacterium]